jgi:hypothetical protein
LGIEPDSRGFKSIKIEPHLGNLKYASGVFPHPLGRVKAEFKKEDGKIKGVIFLPKGLSGRLISQGKTIILESGETKV